MCYTVETCLNTRECTPNVDWRCITLPGICCKKAIWFATPYSALWRNFIASPPPSTINGNFWWSILLWSMSDAVITHHLSKSKWITYQRFKSVPVQDKHHRYQSLILGGLLFNEDLNQEDNSVLWYLYKSGTDLDGLVHYQYLSDDQLIGW